MAIVTITLNAALFRYVPALIRKMEERGIGVSHRKGQMEIPLPSEERDRVIVVGHGPCGELMTDILASYNLDVVVLEMNIDTVTRLQSEGMRVLHGDARLRSILSAAGVEGASAIIVTAAAAPAKEIFETARSLNPKISVMAHTTYMRNAQQLRGHKLTDVYSGEEEVALSMVAGLLRSLGATEEQVFAARKDARKKLAGAKEVPTEPA